MRRHCWFGINHWAGVAKGGAGGSARWREERSRERKVRLSGRARTHLEERHNADHDEAADVAERALEVVCDAEPGRGEREPRRVADAQPVVAHARKTQQQVARREQQHLEKHDNRPEGGRRDAEEDEARGRQRALVLKREIEIVVRRARP